MPLQRCGVRPCGACFVSNFDVVQHKMSCNYRKKHFSSGAVHCELSLCLHDHMLKDNDRAGDLYRTLEEGDKRLDRDKLKTVVL